MTRIKEIEEGVKHWRRLKSCETPEEFYKEGWGAENCHLCCNRYFKSITRCFGWGGTTSCPIVDKTGFANCIGTPYQKAAYAIEDFTADPTQNDYAKAQAAIREEVEFLEEVLEDEKLGRLKASIRSA